MYHISIRKEVKKCAMVIRLVTQTQVEWEEVELYGPRLVGFQVDCLGRAEEGAHLIPAQLVLPHSSA